MCLFARSVKIWKRRTDWDCPRPLPPQAYMREIPDPFTNKPHPCKGGSCLAELQLQLMVVFTAKVPSASQLQREHGPEPH